MFDWDTELTEEQRDALIEKMAQKVAQFGMYVPAIMALEMSKPVAFLAGQGLLLGSGFLAPLFGPQNVQQVSKLMESRANVERLIQRIEELSALPSDRSQSA